MADTTILFTIGGVDYTPYMHIPTLSISDSIPANSDTCSFELRIPSAVMLGAGPYKPLCFEIAQLIVDGVKEFEGPITKVDENPHMSVDVYVYTCECSDYSSFLDKRLVEATEANTNVLPSDNAGNMIKFIIAKYAPEFTTNHVSMGCVIPDQTFDFAPVSSVLDTICQASGFNWYVDFDRDIHFFQSEDLPAPIPEANIDTEVNIGGVSVSEDISRVKNVIFLKDYTSKSTNTQTDSFVTDANQSFFRLNNAPFSWDDVSAQVGGEAGPRTPLEDPLTATGDVIAGGTGEVYVCILNMGVRFPVNDLPGGGVGGTPVDITYNPESVEQAIPMADPDSIRMMAAREKPPFDGKHEKVVSLSNMRVPTLEPILMWGAIILDNLAWPLLKGQFTTYGYPGWKAGQSFILTSAKRDLFDVKLYWKMGVKQSPRVYVQSVAKKFTPSMGDNGDNIFRIQNTINFSTVVAELAV